jgi:hypothetical protein
MFKRRKPELAGLMGAKVRMTSYKDGSLTVLNFLSLLLAIIRDIRIPHNYNWKMR